MRLKLFAALATAALFSAGAASADVLAFTAVLKGASEVPANASKGRGEVDVTFDTNNRTLSYTATYSGLSGPAIGAHFHGPAAIGVDGPVIVAVANAASPIQGAATLTDAQIAELKDGKWYFNVHTKAFPGGEVRGQLRRQAQ